MGIAVLSLPTSGVDVLVLSYRPMAEASSLRPVYLICGSDRPKVRRAVDRLRRRVVAEAGSDLNVTSVRRGRSGRAQTAQSRRAEVLAAALATLQTPSFIPGLRLVLVTNGHRWLAKDRQALVAYLDDPMPDTVARRRGRHVRQGRRPVQGRRRSTARCCASTCRSAHELPAWVRDRATRRAGLAPRRPPRRGTCSRSSGEDPERLERELDKLAAYCRGQEATVEAIDAVCSRVRSRPRCSTSWTPSATATAARPSAGSRRSTPPARTRSACSTRSCATCGCSSRPWTGRRREPVKPTDLAKAARRPPVHGHEARIEQHRSYDRRAHRTAPLRRWPTPTRRCEGERSSPSRAPAG